MRISRLLLLFAAFCAALTAAAADEPVDLDAINRIRDEGFHRSQVMEIAQALTDGFGPRLTGSPSLRQAGDWALRKLAGWGLAQAHFESYEFGRGWSYTRSQVRMIAPRETLLRALPEAWTPGTTGPVRGQAMRVRVETAEDLEKYKGKVRGKILFWDKPRTVETPKTPLLKRHSDQELVDLGAFEIPDDSPSEWRVEAKKRWKLRKAAAEFLTSEGAVAVIKMSSRDAGIVRVTASGGYEDDYRVPLPTLVMSAEGYAEVLRDLDDDKEVTLEIDVETRFHDDDSHAYNVVAEIPGTAKRNEIVMAGAHLDSWHAGTGATDDAAGCAVVMEAVRILRALGVKPNRTIRVALWSGEEQGFLGSRSYVSEHLAMRPEPKDAEQIALPPFLREETWPIQPKAGHAKLSAYFNVDNGGGKIRGIYGQENVAVKPIFEAWLEPLRDLGANTVTLNDTGSTDHIPFARVGLPGFQFIQDDLDYFSRTHHTDLDVYDYLHRDDLMQAAVVVATFLYDAAQRDRMLPRAPMPEEPPKRKEKPKEDGEPAPKP